MRVRREHVRFVLAVMGEQERLVPYTQGVVAEVDLDKGRIQVDWEKDY